MAEAESIPDRCASDHAVCTHDCRNRRPLRCWRLDNAEPLDPVNHPPHYGGEGTYEAINVIEAWGLGFHLGNAVKYIARAGKKGSGLGSGPEAEGLVDLKKARWYLDREIARRERDS